MLYIMLTNSCEIKINFDKEYFLTISFEYSLVQPQKYVDNKNNM